MLQCLFLKQNTEEEKYKIVAKVHDLNLSAGAIPDVVNDYGDVLQPWCECETLEDFIEQLKLKARGLASNAARFAGLAGALTKRLKKEQACD